MRTTALRIVTALAALALATVLSMHLLTFLPVSFVPLRLWIVFVPVLMVFPILMLVLIDARFRFERLRFSYRELFHGLRRLPVPVIVAVIAVFIYTTINFVFCYRITSAGTLVQENGTWVLQGHGISTPLSPVEASYYVKYTARLSTGHALLFLFIGVVYFVFVAPLQSPYCRHRTKI